MAESENNTRRELVRHIGRWDRRLRLTLSTLWLPRGLAVGLIIALTVAILARVRPLLLPNQVTGISIVAVLLGSLAALVVVWLWPRPTPRAARYFDLKFGLKERSSTALEIDEGKIKGAGELAELQTRDALKVAAQIKPRRYLPFQWRRYELGANVLMLAALVLLLTLANPQTAVIAQQAAVNAAIQQQVNQLQQIEKQILENSKLSEEEKQRLREITGEAIKKLQQPNVTQPEAVAALTQASQKMDNASEQLSDAQREALRQAGQSLNQSPSTQDVGKALQSGSMAQAAQQMENLAQRIQDGQLTADQMREMADALEQAAQSLDKVNPQAAQALRQAANALRRGDLQAAAQALQQAAQAMNQQQQQMNQSPLSQQAQQSAQQMQQGSNQVAQAGQPPNQQFQQGQQGQQSAQQIQQGQAQQSGQPTNNQSGQQQSGQGQNAPQGAQQAGQQGQQGQQSQSGQQGQQSQSGQQGQSAQGGQQGQQGAQSGQGGQPGQQGQQGAQGGQQGAGNQQSQQGNTGPGAGQGAGGTGADVTRGQQGPANNPNNLNNGQGSGNLVNNEFIYAPSFVGGQGGQEVQVPNQGRTGENDERQQGEFATNPGGEAKVKISDVVGLAAKQADLAMDKDRVPGALRGVIREYFSGISQ